MIVDEVQRLAPGYVEHSRFVGMAARLAAASDLGVLMFHIRHHELQIPERFATACEGRDVPVPVRSSCTFDLPIGQASVEQNPGGAWACA